MIYIYIHIYIYIVSEICFVEIFWMRDDLLTCMMRDGIFLKSRHCLLNLLNISRNRKGESSDQRK